MRRKWLSCRQPAPSHQPSDWGWVYFPSVLPPAAGPQVLLGSGRHGARGQWVGSHQPSSSL
eukprot:14878160-Alexandrium_andersonii.AAC.1